MSRRIAVLSIGTNSTRLLLADVERDPPRIETLRSVGTRIGEGLGERGRLGEEPMRRTLDALRQHLQAVKGHYVRLIAIATSALRRAENGEAFGEEVRALLGVPLRILSGEEEAAASYRGALTALGKLRGERVGVLDVGGGSTEYAVGSTTEPESVLSCEVGAVRLTEQVPALDGSQPEPGEEQIERARSLAREALQPLSGAAEVERLALVGGTATTVASILRGRSANASYTLRQPDLQSVLERLLALPLDERKRIAGMRPQRADILPAGILVLQSAMELVHVEEAVATHADLLLGVALQERQTTAGRGPR